MKIPFRNCTDRSNWIRHFCSVPRASFPTFGDLRSRHPSGRLSSEFCIPAAWPSIVADQKLAPHLSVLVLFRLFCPDFCNFSVYKYIFYLASMKFFFLVNWCEIFFNSRRLFQTYCIVFERFLTNLYTFHGHFYENYRMTNWLTNICDFFVTCEFSHCCSDTLLLRSGDKLQGDRSTLSSWNDFF